MLLSYPNGIREDYFVSLLLLDHDSQELQVLIVISFVFTPFGYCNVLYSHVQRLEVLDVNHCSKG